MALLLAGLPETVPGVTLNRLCGSGLDAVGTAARAIASGEMHLAIAGGEESMSRAPFVLAKAETAFARSPEIADTTLGWRFINPDMQAAYGTDSMPETGEHVAAQWNVSRADQDAFALRSQQRAAAAIASGYFAEEIVPVEVVENKGRITVSADEHPRPEISLAALERLKPVVRKDGTVTAGNASGINDGAAALLLASEEAVNSYDLTPRARFVGMATAGVAPRIMGIGPVPATRKLLARLGLRIDDFTTWEDLRLFATQYAKGKAVAGFRGLSFERLDKKAIVSREKDLEVLELSDGTLMACGDVGGMPIQGSSKSKVVAGGLNVPTIAETLRSVAFPDLPTGAAYLRYSEETKEGTFLRPAGPLGIFVGARLSLRQSSSGLARGIN